jgi:hypothetical protein
VQIPVDVVGDAFERRKFINHRRQSSISEGSSPIVLSCSGFKNKIRAEGIDRDLFDAGQLRYEIDAAQKTKTAPM